MFEKCQIYVSIGKKMQKEKADLFLYMQLNNL